MPTTRSTHRRERLRAALLTLPAVALTAGACSSSAGTHAGSSSGGSANPYGLIRAGVITAATQPAQPPFAMADDQGRPSGFIVDITKALATRLHLRVEFRSTTVTASLAGLTSGQYDLAASGLGVTAEREKSVAFTKPLFWSTTVVLTKGGGPRAKSDFAGKRVGVVTGSAQETFVANMPGARSTKFPDQNAGIQQLLNGNIDAFVLGGPDAHEYTELHHELRPAYSAPVDHPTAMALQKNKTAFQGALNQAIASMITDGSYARLYKKYFTSAPQPELIAAWPQLKTQFAVG